MTNTAVAQTSQPEVSVQAAAEASFLEGVKLMKANRCEEAIVKFRESEQLELASGTCSTWPTARHISVASPAPG